MPKADGSVIIDTKINSSGIQKGTKLLQQSFKDTASQAQEMSSKIGSAFKKIGKLIVAAFATQKLVQFGKECLELGSDLQEVQNVVDVVFTTMSGQVDEFAKNAAQNFGLSETMAKRYTGTFGAMAKSFGFTEQEAYNMSTALTGLAGDVASFYNISQDEAYTKLKSVFSGETETLKDLGIVMTQNALDAYAMANGWGKTTQAMTEQEKVALRYQFVMQQLSSASGDFIRTSDSWANQTRMLQLQFDSLKASIGQGLINIFTPVIKVINTIMGKLVQLANSFKSFTDFLFGTKSSGQATSTISQDDLGSIGSGYESAAQGAQDYAQSTGDAAKATKKAAKESKGYLSSLDQINKLSEDNTGGSGSGASGGAGGGGIGSIGGAVTFPSQIESGTDGALDAMKSKFESFFNWVSGSFGESFNTFFSNFKTNVSNLGTTFKGIFSDLSTLTTPLMNWLNTDFVNFGNQLILTADSLFNGAFDSLNMAISDIWNKFMFPVLSNFVTVGLPMITQFATQALATLQTFFEEAKKIFDMLWSEGVAPALELISSIWTDFVNLLAEKWEQYGEPIFEKIREAIRTTSDLFQKIWDTILKPVWDKFMAVIEEVWDNHLKPFIGKFLDFVATLVQGALDIYNKFIAPVVGWFVDVFGPTISDTFNFILELVGAVVGNIIDFAGNIIDRFSAVVEFFAGVFTLDFKRAWNAIKDFYKSVWDGMVNLMKAPINLIIGAINQLITGVVGGLNNMIRALNKLSFKVPDWVPLIGGNKFGFNIKTLTAPRIPYLATGAVIPPNAPFMAVLGDQRRGNNIEAPESLIRRIVREESGNQGAGGNYYFTAQINRRTLFEEFITEAKLRQMTTGKNPFELA